MKTTKQTILLEVFKHSRFKIFFFSISKQKEALIVHISIFFFTDSLKK